MRVKLSLHRATGTVDDVVVTADGTATVGDVADALWRCDPNRSAATPDPSRLTVAVARGGGYVALDRSLGLGESGVRSGAMIALMPAPERFRDAGGGPAAATVTVVAGPDAGKRFDVPVGTTVIGRAHDCDLQLSDPLVSKQHARLSVGDFVELTDLNSSNGIIVAGSLTRRVTLGPDDVAVLGDSAIRVLSHVASAVRDNAVQGLAFNRSPRVLAHYEGGTISLPEPPELPGRQRFPLIALMAPLLMAAILFLVTRSLTSIVFAALSPLFLVGQWLESKIGGTRGFRAQAAQYREALQVTQSEIDAEAAVECARRDLEHPSTYAVLDAVQSHGSLLWSRHPGGPGFLELRLGVGRAASRTKLEMPRDAKTTPELRAAMAAVAEHAGAVAPVPIVAVLPECGALGVAGPENLSLPVARGLIAQLVGLHSPAEVVLALVTDAAGANRWSWLRWIPHTSSDHTPLAAPHLAADAMAGKALLATLEELVELRSGDQAAAEADETAVVLLVEDAAPVDRARLVWLAEHGPAARVHLIWVSPSVDRLPAACRTFVDLSLPAAGGAQQAGFGRVGDVGTGAIVEPVQVEPVDPESLAAVGRLLAPVFDAGARVDDDTDLPRTVSLLTLAGPQLALDPSAVLERWRLSGSLPPADGERAVRKRSAGLGALVGTASTEPFYLDLRTQGPHALVGGTTGAGKSEFLQSWVLGLASTFSPARVTFLFVDYKGGAAFGECRNLPHAVGMITDLTPHRFKRTLASLRAELKYREHLLNTKKAKDLFELEDRGDPDTPPSLVIVVDEFAALVNDVPEFVDGMVDVAQRGRSLGLHLILATQRPTGVIRDNLRANTNLRIALRMADEADSTDVLGTPVAAAITPGLAGRGFAKTGPGRLTAFQTGYAGGWTSDRPPAPSVVIEQLDFGPRLRWEEPEVEHQARDVDLGPTDMQRMVAVFVDAARQANLQPPRRPWMPTLAPVYRLDQLPTRRSDASLVFGVLDDPDNQQQRTVAFNPDEDGNLAVYGTGGAGKSTLLRTFGVAAGFTARGGPCHVYGLDFGSRGLAMLEDLPHVGSVIAGEDRERLTRLLRWLRGLIDERAAAFARANAGTITEYRQRAERPQEPRVLLLVDGVGAFRQAQEGQRSGLWELFIGIAADGRPVGVHVIVGAERALAVPSTLGSVIQKRVVLRMASNDDYSTLGLPMDALPATAAPGRGFIDGHEVQVAVLGGSASNAEQARAVTALAESMHRAGAVPAQPIRALETRIPLGSLPEAVDGRPVIGVADDSLLPFAFNPAGTFLISGPPRSGRTTCLATIAMACRRAKRFERFVYFGPGSGPVPRLLDWTTALTDVTDVQLAATELAQELASPGVQPTLFVVETASTYLGDSADSALQALAKACAAHGHGFIAEGEMSSLTSVYGSGLFSTLKNARSGLLLEPDGGDGDTLLRTSLPNVARADAREGRGYVLSEGRVRYVQMALPEDG